MICMGIDAGGSTLRVGLFTETLECLHLEEFQETANPSIIGFEKVGILLRSSLIETLKEPTFLWKISPIRGSRKHSQNFYIGVHF